MPSSQSPPAPREPKHARSRRPVLFPESINPRHRRIASRLPALVFTRLHQAFSPLRANVTPLDITAAVSSPPDKPGSYDEGGLGQSLTAALAKTLLLKFTERRCSAVALSVHGAPPSRQQQFPKPLASESPSPSDSPSTAPGQILTSGTKGGKVPGSIRGETADHGGLAAVLNGKIVICAGIQPPAPRRAGPNRKISPTAPLSRTPFVRTA